MIQLAKVFALNRKGLNLPRGLAIAAVLVALGALLVALDREAHVLTFVFAVLLAALGDPGGSFAYRAQRMTLFGVIGALCVGAIEIAELSFTSSTIAWACRLPETGPGKALRRDGTTSPARETARSAPL